jgi:hypothetical protein
MREVKFDAALAISGEYIEIPVHADEAGESRRLREASRFERVTAIAAGPLQTAIASGKPALLARHLAANPGDTGTVIEMLAAGEMVEGEQMLRAINLMVGGKDEEAFETWDARKKLMEHFVARVSRGGFADSRGPRAVGANGGSRVRGALAPADPAPEPRPDVIDGSAVESDDRPRRSRVVMNNSAGPRATPGRGGTPRRSMRDPDLEDGE